MQQPMFDVFLAHNSLDKPQVKAIAQKLKHQQLKPWLDEEQILGGDIILEKVYSGITQCRTGAFFISRNGLGNFQENIELYTVINWFLKQQRQSKSFRVIPILLPGVTKIPDRIAHLEIWRWIQFSSFNDESALQDLIRSIKPETPFKIPESPLPRRQFLKWVGLGSLGLVISVIGKEILNKLNQPTVTSNEPPGSTLTATPEVKSPKSTPTGDNTEGISLESEIRIDYAKLCNLLAVGNWKGANQETYEVMNQALKGVWISETLSRFPCTDLHTIDQLWVKFSKGNFGFSVQKEIYLSVGGKADGEYYEETLHKFGDRVGWRLKSSWIDYNRVTFDKYALKGHLPVIFIETLENAVTGNSPELSSWTVYSLASRLVKCNQ